jgi:hypothetical protein
MDSEQTLDKFFPGSTSKDLDKIFGIETDFADNYDALEDKEKQEVSAKHSLV